MGQFYDEIPDDPKLIEWIQKQPMFHVASAPLNGDAHPSPTTSTSLTTRRWQRKCVAEGPVIVQAREQEGLLVFGLGRLWYVRRSLSRVYATHIVRR